MSHAPVVKYSGEILVSMKTFDQNIKSNSAYPFLLDCLKEYCGSGIVESNAKYFSLENIVKLKTGQPVWKSFAKFSVSLSHSKNVAAVAISDSYNVGIDIQHIRQIDPAVFDRILSEDDRPRNLKGQTFFEYWTIKEATQKYLGTGFQFPMNKIVIDEAGHKVRIVDTKLAEHHFDFQVSQESDCDVKYFDLEDVPEGFIGHVVAGLPVELQNKPIKFFI